MSASRDIDRLRTLDDLWKLLRNVTVQVVGDKLGTGFFVAPGFVLTCSHLVTCAGQRVSIRWGGRVLLATVRYASSGVAGDRSDYPDLAVVELEEALPGQPCAWLDFRRPINGTMLTIVGFADEVDGSYSVKTLRTSLVAPRD